MMSCVKTLLPDKTYYAQKRQISSKSKELNKELSGQTKHKGFVGQ